MFITGGALSYDSGTYYFMARFQSPAATNDWAKVFLTTGQNSWNLQGNPINSTTQQLDIAMANWSPWSGQMSFGGLFGNYSWDTLYLHVFVTDGWSNTWYLMQPITFIPNTWWGGWMPALIVSELVAEWSWGVDWIEFLSLSGDRQLSGWTLDVYDNAGVLTTYNLTGGTIPASGLLVLQYEFPNTWGMIVLKNSLWETWARVIYNDSWIYNNDTQNYAWIIPLGKSATQGMWWVRSINNNPNPGWFNDAVDVSSCNDLLWYLATPPTLRSIANCLSGEAFGGVLTNMWDMQDPTNTPSSWSGALYFEKPWRGKITFKQHMNLTDEATTKLLQAMGAQLDMQSWWKIGFDASITWYISDTLRTANAELVMYNVNQLGVYEALSSGMIFSKDSDTHEILTGAALPDLSWFAYTGANSGTLSFMTNHFTSFEIARIKNITQTWWYDTIQAAIDSAQAGDIITVASGIYTEDIVLYNWPFTLSWIGSPIISGTITLKNYNEFGSADSITITGFAPIYTLYADLADINFNQYYTLSDAISYIASGGTIYIDGWSGNLYSSYAEDGVITINKSMSIIGTWLDRPKISFYDPGLSGQLIVDAPNVIFRNINFVPVDYASVPSMIQTPQVDGVSFNNCAFNGLVENTDTSWSWLNATGNYRYGNPVTGTSFSWNIYYIPRCLNDTCTTLVNSNAMLSNLTVTGRTLSWAFSSGVTWYTITVPYQRTGTITATPTTNDSGATWTWDNYITLLTGWSTWSIIITVTASDTTTTWVYTITVTRSAPSTDANLASLSVSPWTLSWAFNSWTNTYTVNFAYSYTGTVSITGAKNDAFATITSWSYSLPLTVGSTWSMFITVTAEDSSTKTYTVTVTRSAPSTNTSLSWLVTNTGTLYWFTWLEVPYNFSWVVSLTPTAFHPYATITWNYSAPFALWVTWTLTVVVTAEDGTTTWGYSIVIFRTAASSDANLSSLILTGLGAGLSFSSWTINYTVNFAYSATGTVSITWTKNDTYASIISWSYSLLLTVGSTWSMYITVQAEDWTIKTYTVTITRSAPSTDANLASLSVSPWTLSWAFNSWINTYTVNYAYSQTGTVTITWTKNDTFASITSWNYSLPLTVGSTWSMFITVTAEDSSTKTYTVTVTRSAPSTNTSLSGLTTNTGILYWFTWVEIPYAFSWTVSLTPTAFHPYATITWNYSAPFALWVTWTLTIKVIAEDGTTSWNYSVNVFRTPASTDATLLSLSPSTGTLSPSFSSGTYTYNVLIPYSYIGTITATPTTTNSYATISWSTSVSWLTTWSAWTITFTVIAENWITTLTNTIYIFRINTLSNVSSTVSWTTVTVAYITDMTATWYVAYGTSTLNNIKAGPATTGHSFAITWLTNNVTYSYRVYALNGGQTWNYSATGTFTIDTIAPILSWAAAVTNLTSQTPSYSFTGSEAGTITYSWLCSSATTAAISWLNTIVFSALANATYTWCQLKVTDTAGNISDWLPIPTFTVNYTAPSWGGGWGSNPIKDVCPDGDNSPSFYDNKCEPSWSTTWALHWQAIRYTWSIRESQYSSERNNAYLHAYGIGITTMNTIQDADMEWFLIRAHMAKMMATYAIKILHQTPNTWALCIFNDVAHQSTEMRFYITLACQLGLMGVGVNDFDPNGEVTRAQFGTVLSRALYGSGSNTTGEFYYLNHLNALKANNIITNINPYLKEIRWYVMLMLYRAQ